MASSIRSVLPELIDPDIRVRLWGCGGHRGACDEAPDLGENRVQAEHRRLITAQSAIPSPLQRKSSSVTRGLIPCFEGDCAVSAQIVDGSRVLLVVLGVR